MENLLIKNITRLDGFSESGQQGEEKYIFLITLKQRIELTVC